MPSVHKKPGSRSPYWFAAYRGPDGRRVQKSTKTRDKAKALKIAVEWEALANKGRNGGLIAAQVRKVVAELVEQATGEPLHFQTVADYFTHWKTQGDAGKARNTAIKYTQTVDSFLKALGKRATQPLGNIGPGDLEKWRDALQKGGRTPATVNFNLKVVSIAFQKAHKLGYITVNPCHGLEAIRDNTEAERDVFTPEQVKALIEAGKGTDWEGAVLVAYFTGLRLGDVATLTWAEVDTTASQGWFLRRKTAKTRKEVAIPVHPDLRAFLEPRQGVGRAPLFRALHGGKPGGNTGLSTQFKNLMEKAGISGRVLRKGGGGARQTTSLSFHSLRHSFTSAMANAGVPEEVRMLLTGHSTRRAHKTYTHHEEAQVWAAIATVPGVTV
jgi:integrase